ncbi:30S ribosomal protein S8 [soil metagenome]
MDKIADMITSLKNAGNAKKSVVNVPYSKIKENIAAVLITEGFLKSAEKKIVEKKAVLSMEILMENRVPKIKGAQRISKTSKRVYKKSAELRPVKNGYGALVISTPKGVMSGRDAKKQKIGGEVLFSIW